MQAKVDKGKNIQAPESPPPVGGDVGGWTGNIDAANHVTGRSIYVDDIPVMEGMLFVKVFDSPIAHGTIKKLDFSVAEQMQIGRAHV